MRKHYLDNIRWITVVLVVIYHVIYMYNAEGIPGVLGNITGFEVQYYDLYQYMVYPWFMFLLFTVSGISSRLYLEKHTNKEFIKSRTTKLLVPSTIGLFAFQFIQGYFNTRLSDAQDMMQTVPAPVAFLIMMLSGIGVLWYIQLLWVFSMILVPVRILDKDRLYHLGAKAGDEVLVFMVLPVFFAAQILNTPVICVYRFGYYGIAFLLGYFVFSHDEVVELLKKRFFFFLVVAVILGAGFCILHFGKNYADAPLNRGTFFVSFGWYTTLAFLGGGARFLDFENRFTKWMSAHSWGLYIFHYLGISLIAVCIGKRRILPAALVYILSLVTSFVLAYVLEAVISRLPFFRWAVLGIKKKK